MFSLFLQKDGGMEGQATLTGPALIILRLGTLYLYLVTGCTVSHRRQPLSLPTLLMMVK